MHLQFKFKERFVLGYVINETFVTRLKKNYSNLNQNYKTIEA